MGVVERRPRIKHRAKRIVAPLVVLLSGVAVMAILVATKPTPAKEEAGDQGVMVRVKQLTGRRERLRVEAQGTVVPAEEISLLSEVEGRVIWRNQELIPGGRFRRGDLLFRLDDREYEFRVAQSAADVEQAKQALALEESQQAIAQQEWALIGEDLQATEEGKSVALREPQLKQAQANLAAARRVQDLAELNVHRTVLRAPFNGFVRGEVAYVGQLVSPNTQLATLVGSDVFWVQVSVPVDKLTRLAVPGVNATEGEGARALVEQRLADGNVVRRGRVVRLLGDLDPVGRMARLLVEISDPLRLGERGEELRSGLDLPLLLGAYVHVVIEGVELIDVVEVPRSAVVAGGSVYVFGKDGRLDIREIDVAWRREDTLLVRDGVEKGELVVMSRLPNAVPGLKLRKATGEKGSKS